MPTEDKTNQNAHLQDTEKDASLNNNSMDADKKIAGKDTQESRAEKQDAGAETDKELTATSQNKHAVIAEQNAETAEKNTEPVPAPEAGSEHDSKQAAERKHEDKPAESKKNAEATPEDKQSESGKIQSAEHAAEHDVKPAAKPAVKHDAVDAKPSEDNDNEQQKKHLTGYQIAAIIMGCLVIAGLISLFVFMPKLVYTGQVLEYQVTGGAMTGIIITPTAESYIYMTIAMCLCALSIRTLLESIWAAGFLDMTVGKFIQSLVAYVISFIIIGITTLVMPNWGTSAWIGAIIVCVWIAWTFFIHPDDGKLSLIPAVRQYAKEEAVSERN